MSWGSATNSATGAIDDQRYFTGATDLTVVPGEKTTVDQAFAPTYLPYFVVVPTFDFARMFVKTFGHFTRPAFFVLEGGAT